MALLYAFLLRLVIGLAYYGFRSAWPASQAVLTLPSGRGPVPGRSLLDVNQDRRRLPLLAALRRVVPVLRAAPAHCWLEEVLPKALTVKRTAVSQPSTKTAAFGDDSLSALMTPQRRSERSSSRSSPDIVSLADGKRPFRKRQLGTHGCFD
jgi:hypothetical protein